MNVKIKKYDTMNNGANNLKVKCIYFYNLYSENLSSIANSLKQIDNNERLIVDLKKKKL